MILLALVKVAFKLVWLATNILLRVAEAWLRLRIVALSSVIAFFKSLVVLASKILLTPVRVVSACPKRWLSLSCVGLIDDEREANISSCTRASNTSPDTAVGALSKAGIICNPAPPSKLL